MAGRAAVASATAAPTMAAAARVRESGIRKFKADRSLADDRRQGNRASRAEWRLGARVGPGPWHTTPIGPSPLRPEEVLGPPTRGNPTLRSATPG
ncbi:hypothetical protein GCM10018790_21410 [Kitasatospora xanthocidica]|nr:hypothetical protein GCM10018790_21410 [Kitasatospora xanthocidica]